MATDNPTKLIHSDSENEELEQYGVWVKAGPEIVDGPEEVVAVNLSDLTDDMSDAGIGLTKEEEELLGDLEDAENGGGALSLDDLEDFTFDEPEAQAVPAAAAGEAETGEEIPELDFETATIESAAKDIEETLDLDAELDLDLDIDADAEALMPTADDVLGLQGLDDLEISLDDEQLPELEADQTEPMDLSFEEEAEIEPARETLRPIAGEPARAENSMLEKIEAELSSIKSELAELKRELARLKRPPAAVEGQEPAEDEDEKAGFFDEDEDETIALTGDELDNILSSADITEAKGESDVLEEDIHSEPATTEEEKSIIDEYNRELDSFKSDEILLDDEDDINLAQIEELPEEPVEKAAYEEISLEDDNPAEPAELAIDLDTEEMEIHIPAVSAKAEDEAAEELFEPQLSETELLTPSYHDEPELEPAAAPAVEDAVDSGAKAIPDTIRDEIRSVLRYMDQLLEALPEEKIQEFARSEHFEVYKRLFEELGLE